MWRAEILTDWIGDGLSLATGNRPHVANAYALARYEDVTGQPSANLQPDPNQFIVRIECEVDVLEAIESDNDYLVLWSEEVVDDAI